MPKKPSHRFVIPRMRLQVDLRGEMAEEMRIDLEAGALPDCGRYPVSKRGPGAWPGAGPGGEEQAARFWVEQATMNAEKAFDAIRKSGRDREVELSIVLHLIGGDDDPHGASGTAAKVQTPIQATKVLNPYRTMKQDVDGERDLLQTRRGDR